MSTFTSQREHYLTDTYERDGTGGLRVACHCGWRSEVLGLHPGPNTPVDEDTLDLLNRAWKAHVRPLVTPHPDQVLELRVDHGGQRHYLAGDPVYCGSPLELLMPGGVWIRGGYEMRRRVDHDGHDVIQAVFYTSLGGPAADNNVPDYMARTHFDLPDRAVVRRPERSGR